MVFRVSADKKFLILTSSTEIEFEQLQFSLTKRKDNYYIIKKKLAGKGINYEGEERFIDQYNRIPIGLIKEILNICKKYMFQVKIEGLDDIYDGNFDSTNFINWVDEYFTKKDVLYPYEYQIEACNRLFKFKNCTEEISTSGGKTLIAFLFFKYLYEKKKAKKFLYVVPNVGLVTQSEEKFYIYESKAGHKPNWKSQCIYAEAEKIDYEPNIVFGTYQSLIKKDLDFFKQFDAVIIDEVHHAKCTSIRSILIKCINAQYKIGLTGTLPKEGTHSSFIVQSYLGPCIYKLESHQLIKQKNATPIKVVCIEMDYLEQEEKKKLYDLRNTRSDEDNEKDGAKLLDLEKNVARLSRLRFNYICGTVAKSTKNSLVLFSDIKNDYGRKIYDWLRENTDKSVYYIDGGTKPANRDFYKKKMEEDPDTIIVASIGTFSEGIDILNLYNIFIVESYKSQFIVRQILGRGMRLMDGKEEVTVIDFRDNYCYGTGYQRDNYLMRHAKERDLIYKEKRFPYKIFRVKL